ncbi:MAG: T9SS type A sorting domain-containing protein [Bacteroidales bacterium]|nr:T9SS type A sorting domain-containing protein [Bacteroidales bacterium]
MRKFTTLILNLLVLAIALPLGAVAQEEPTLNFDSYNWFLCGDTEQNRLIEEEDRAVTCNKPEIHFFKSSDESESIDDIILEQFPQVESKCTARLYSNGLLDTLCAVNYNVYKDGQSVSTISNVGSLKYKVRTYSDNYTTQTISNGSGTIGFSMLGMSCNAVTLGIFDNYCTGRNRPIEFIYKMNQNQYGLYKLHFTIKTCTDAGSRIADNWLVSMTGANASFTANGATCCGSALHYDYYNSSCTQKAIVYERDVYINIVSTIIDVQPIGGEICMGGSKTLSVTARTNQSGITYQWYKDGAAISGATAATYNATEAGTYYCLLNDGRATRQTNDAVITIPPMPEVTLAADQYICPNSSLDLTMPAGATYVWSTGATGQTLNVTNPGTYTVTMTSNGCNAAHSFNVQNSPAVNLLADDPVSFCYGATETLALTVNNATNIVWNGDAANNGQTYTISESGTYTVAADVNGCHFTDQVVATQGENVNLIADETVSFCYGATQTLALAVNNATDIVWNNNAANNGQTFVINQGGTYTVSAKVDGCTYTDQIVATQFENVNLIADETVNFCYGTTETLELAVNNATNIVWNNNPANNGQTFVINEGGTYTVSANVGGCNFSDQIVATQSENVNLIADETVNFCYGTTETLALAVNNATDIVWNNDAANNGQTFVINQSGTYNITAKVDGCTYTDQITATQSESVNLIADETVNFCYGTTETLALAVNNATDIVWNNDAANNGQTFVINQGGTYPVSAKVGGCIYTDQIVATQTENVNLIADETVNFCYGTTETLELAVNNATDIVWNNDAANNAQTFVINQSGTYPVSAKVDGCTYTDQIVATQSENVNLIADETVNFCYGTTETLELTVNNATDIVWNNDAANNGQTFVINQSGTYPVSAKVDGCTFTDQIVATQSGNVNLIADETVDFCYGTTQTLALALNNATDIVWNNDAANNGQTFVINQGGTYSVSAKVDGCTYTDQIVANQSENVNLLQFDNIQFCYGTSQTLELTVNNATNIVWNNDPSLNETTLVVSELGTYTVEADVDGCHYTDEIVAIETQNYNLIPEESVVICYGSTAMLNLPATAINAVWNNNPELNQNTLEISEAGTYTVSADYNGCRYNDQVVATIAPELTVAVNAGTINCNGGTTTVEAVANGGVAPYAYAWNNNATTQSIDVAAGSYNLTVTDGNGCIVTATTTIEEPAALSAEINAEAINCHGGTTTAIANVSGGTEPYAFAWNNNAAAQSIEATAGEYNVVVTDAHNCTIAASANIEEPAALAVTINAGTINCNGGTANVEATANGGVEPYAYAWNNGEATASIEAGVGDYIVTVTDNNRCTASASVILTEPEALSVSLNAGTILCNGGTTTIEATANGGVEPYAFAWGSGEVASVLTNVVAGNYIVTVTDNSGCTAIANTTISEPAALTVTINAGTIGCNGTTATAEAVVAGGVAPYAFAWSNQATTQSISDVVPGSYNVTVTDGNGCTAMATAVVTEPAMLSVSINAGTINCNGGTTAVEANVTGGTTPYALAWSNNETAQNINATAGEYSVIVTDANGCTAMASTTIEEPAALTASIIVGTISCNGGTTMAVAHVNGGVAPYSYSWSNQGTAQNISNIVAGDYSVTVVDNNGCSATTAVTVTEPEYVNLIADETVTFCEGSTVTVTLVEGATNVVWGNSEVGANNEIGVAGTYTVEADVAGCHYTDQVTAVASALPVSGLERTYSVLLTNADTTIIISANEGYESYLWSNGGTENSLSIYCDTLVLPFDADYYLNIATASGCSSVDTISVHVEMSPSSVSEFDVYEWNIVPNPNDGNFEIVGAEFDKAELYDSNGRFIALIEGKDVSLSDVKPGMYYLRIYSEAGVLIQKVLINK